MLYEVRCLKSNEDMIIALAGQFKQLSHEPENFSGDSTGFEPMTSAIPVQCSNQLNKNLVLSNELIKVKLPPWKIWKADVSSVSPSSERLTNWATKSHSWKQVNLLGSCFPLKGMSYERNVIWSAVFEIKWRHDPRFRWTISKFFRFMRQLLQPIFQPKRGH